jgi:hypothetical protein
VSESASPNALEAARDSLVRGPFKFQLVDMVVLLQCHSATDGDCIQPLVAWLTQLSNDFPRSIHALTAAAEFSGKRWV